LLEPSLLDAMLAHLDGLQGLGLDLIGAEPTVNPALPELVAAVSGAGFRPRLFSNGTLIDRKLARELVRAGLRQATISIDGGLDATHDRLRGVEGSRRLALAAVEHLAGEGRGSGLEISTFSVVSRHNYAELAQIAQTARAQGAGRCSFHWVSQVPADACRSPGASAQYRAGETSALLDPTELGPFRRSVASVPAAGRSASLALLRALGTRTLLEGRFPVASCRFVPISLNLSTSGEAYACSHLTGFSWGSLAEASWKRVWQAPRRQRFLRDLRRALHPPCAYCCHHMHNLTLFQLLRVVLGGRLR
jgi:MoaA/NifB/PqqE/SkfB family radical SAM enzyme